jgi:hypothetical protein
MDMAAALEQFNEANLKRALAQAVEDGDTREAAVIRARLDDAVRDQKETR